MKFIFESGGDFLLADENKPAVIFSYTDDKSVMRALSDLCADFKRIGLNAYLTENEENANITVAVEQNGGRECYEINAAGEKLHICGSDKRGAIYGIYELSEQLGISPFYWWADVKPKQRKAVFVKNIKYSSKEPSVRYRGIFINDEENLAAWAINRGDYDYKDLYKKVYELLLRLKANTLWPAMHSCSPYFHKNPKNAENADLYGIVIGTSHCEQMLRNNVYEYLPFEQKWIEDHPDKPLYFAKLGDAPKPCAYNYVDKDPQTGEKVYNKELLTDYWQDSIEKFGQYENIYTVGLRGLHDSPWNPPNAEEEKAGIIEEVMKKQSEILSENAKDKNAPKLFIPYKEILDIYNSGMKVPEDITLMWTNDNYGYIRQLPTEEEQNRSGGIGMYYHVSYCGRPKSYCWLSTTPAALIREEMTKAYSNGIDRIWILNVGDIKAAETEMEYFLRLAYDVNSSDVREHIKYTAKRDFLFNEEDAENFAGLELEFERLCFARKPEFMESGLLNLKDFGDEGMRYLKKYRELERRSRELYEKTENKTAYFELHLYRLISCESAAAQVILMDENRQHVADGFFNAAEHYIYLSDDEYCNRIDAMREYDKLSDGKWKDVMLSARNDFVERKGEYPGLIGCKKSWAKYPGVGAAHEKLVFSSLLDNSCFIDIFNHYNSYVSWKATAGAYICLSKNEGIVSEDERIWVNIDYSKVPNGYTKDSIRITSDFGDDFELPVEIYNESGAESAHIEFNGYVSVYAKDFTKMTAGEKLIWREEKYLGREVNAMKVCSDDGRLCEDENGAVLEYDVDFKSEGEFEVEIYRIPTLNENGEVRIGIAADNSEPCFVKCNNKYKDYSDGSDVWGKSVMRNCEIVSAKINICGKGRHTVKIYAADSDVMIEKLVIWTGEKVKSYFGPPSTCVEEKKK